MNSLFRTHGFEPLVNVEDGSPGSSEKAAPEPESCSCLRVKLAVRKMAKKAVRRNSHRESFGIKAPQTLFKLMLLFLTFAVGICIIGLKFNVLTLWMQYWIYVLILFLIGILLLLAGMISPRFYANHSTSDSLQASWAKMQVLAKFLFPVILFYGDVISDILLIFKFWGEGMKPYAILNFLAILAGSTASVVNGVENTSLDSLLLTVVMFFQLTPLAVALQSIGLFCAAVDSSGTDPRYKDLVGYLRDRGCYTLLAHALVGEAFTEALLSTFLQTYALLRHSISWTLLTELSLVFSIGSIVKSFAKLDLRGHVSRDIKGQAIVVGLAEWTSLPFILVVIYRLAEVASQVLFFPFFQMVEDRHGVIFGLRCSGVLFWLLDLVLQAALVYHSTRNPKKLLWAVPNTIGAFEPMLLAGSEAVFCTSARLQVLIHFFELVLGTAFVCFFHTQRVYDFCLERPHIICGLLVCNVVKYGLFIFIRTFSAYPVICSEEFPFAKILSKEAIEVADLADKRVPLEVVIYSNFSLDKGTDRKKIFDAMNRQSDGFRDDMAGNVCHLVSRLAYNQNRQRKESLIAEGAGKAVLAAVDMHIDDEQDDVPALRGACRAILNLTVGSAENKRFLAEHGPGMMLKCMQRKDRFLRRYACFTLEALVADKDIRAKMSQHWKPIVGNLEAEHRADNLLQTAACGLIAKLACDEHLRKELVRGGCHADVVESMRRHPNDMDVQRDACFALRMLAPAFDPETQFELLSMGVRADIRKAMENHSNQPSFQYEAWNLLQSLDAGGAGRHAFAVEGDCSPGGFIHDREGSPRWRAVSKGA
ncbi:aarA [Symbiodinium necroappetens]|uniref:AarA protein n=1 Tax=Symbiodinium necroappetens TaxID=1628268 RepID=A0A812JPM5_9DINO|nr:aarA [Symbiodinium necroappetens]